VNQLSENDILESQIRECYGRVVWTHKTQEKCSDILNTRNGWIKLSQIILSAVITTGILVSVFGNQKEWVGILSAIISTVLLILNTYTKKHDLGEIAQKHANCAANLWDIRETYLSLLVDIRSGTINADEIRRKRDKLQNDLLNIYKGSPRSFGKAYNEASKALIEMEEMTFTDPEIDKFLPKDLRKINRQ
jgi:SMODS and SLOG-associating 2TM effector domain family 4